MTGDEFVDMVPIVTGEVKGDPLKEIIAGGAALVQTKTEFQTAVAVQKPRTLNKIVSKVLKEADYAGKDFYYSWPVKDRKTGKTTVVEGPSIGAAMSLLREWGNCALVMQVEDHGAFMMFTPSFVDLETGTTITRAFKYHPTSAPGKFDTDRWADMQFQVAQSKAMRNVVSAAMPRWLLAQIVDRAKKAELSYVDKVGLVESRLLAVEYYAKQGVERERLEASLGKRQDEWDREDVVHLRNIGHQYKDGEIDLNEAFPPLTAPPANPAPPVQSKPAQTAPAPGEPQEEATSSNPEGTIPNCATEDQRQEMMKMLSYRKAGQRYGCEVGNVLAALNLDQVTDMRAQDMIDCLGQSPPIWTPFDTAMNHTPATEEDPPANGKTKKGSQQGSLV